MNVIHYTSYMTALIVGGQLEAAGCVIDLMLQTGVAPDFIVYSTLLKAYSDEGRVMDALRTLDQMVSRNIVPDAVLFNKALVGCCVRRMDAEIVLHVFRCLLQHGLEVSTV